MQTCWQGFRSHHGCDSGYNASHLGYPSMSTNSTADPDQPITQLLMELSKGNRDVDECLAPQTYGQLRQIAARLMRRERSNHTLQPTALVNEAYTHLIQQAQIPWQSRAHFYAIASRLMRRILVDHARARNARKRGALRTRLR